MSEAYKVELSFYRRALLAQAPPGRGAKPLFLDQDAWLHYHRLARFIFFIQGLSMNAAKKPTRQISAPWSLKLHAAGSRVGCAFFKASQDAIAQAVGVERLLSNADA
jgi:hypothetical protein